MTHKTLHTKNLSIGYKNKSNETVVAKSISINLEKGKLIALIGSNGIGKSTLLKTITKLIAPINGTVFLNDKDLNDYNSQNLAKELSVVLTEHLPPSNLSVYEIIALGRQPYTNWLGKLSDKDKIKIDEAIKLTAIEAFQHKKHHEISDGQLQKTLIARALAQDTSLIILDEPTTHLDLVNKVTILKLLQKLAHQTQKTILYSTHDIDLAIQLSDEIIVMNSEKTVQEEPCKLIEQGVFKNLFNNEHIDFDANFGKFIVK